MTDVVLDVTTPDPLFGFRVSKDSKDAAGMFSDYISQHVEPASMRHSQDCLPYTEARGLFESEIQ